MAPPKQKQQAKSYENKKQKSPNKLDMKAVCERAKSIPGCRQVYPNPALKAAVPDSASQKSNNSQTSNKIAAAAKGNATTPATAATTTINDALVSFMVDLPVGLNKSSSIHNSTPTSPTTTARDVARVNIFCDTGTIGVCRVLHGQVRQTFRRSVSSLDVVERLLRNPPELTNIDASLVERFEPVGNENDKKATTTNAQPTSTLQQDLELAEVGLYILQGERDKLSNHLTALEEKEDDGTKASHDTSSDGGGHHHHRGHHPPTPMAAPLDVVAGMEFQFSLPVETMTQVEQCLQDISSLGKIVKHVATNGKSTIFLYGHGGVAYTSHIPKPLHHRLKQLQRSAPEKRPCYVSLGSRERYFVGFYDGTADWKGPKALDKILKERMHGAQTGANTAASSNSSNTSVSTLSTSKSNFPQSVAFGSSFDTFFVVFGDGSWVCEGRGIPEALEDKLADRADRADLVCVTLGPKGEWFLRAENGRMWWGGISSELDQLIQDLLEAGNYLSFIDFGDDGSYFVSYDDAEETEEDDEEDK